MSEERDGIFEIEFSEGTVQKEYAGPYEVTPGADDQVLATTGRTAIDDITVKKIPETYHDTSDATVQSEDMRSGVIAYGAQGKVVGDGNLYDTSDATATAATIVRGNKAYGPAGLIVGEGDLADYTGVTAEAADVMSGKKFITPQGLLGEGTGTMAGPYGYFGAGTEYRGILAQEIINLAEDTTYDSWTPTTSSASTTILAQETGYSVSEILADLNDYTYFYVISTMTDVVPIANPSDWSGLTHRTYGNAVYAVSTKPMNWNELVAGESNYTAVDNVSVLSYSFNYGTLTYGPGGSFSGGNFGVRFSGPGYVGFVQPINQGSGVSGRGIQIRRGAVTAACYSGYFDRLRKTDVDSTKTNVVWTVEGYKTPNESSFMAEMKRRYVAAFTQGM